MSSWLRLHHRNPGKCHGATREQHTPCSLGHVSSQGQPGRSQRIKEREKEKAGGQRERRRSEREKERVGGQREREREGGGTHFKVVFFWLSPHEDVECLVDVLLPLHHV